MESSDDDFTGCEGDELQSYVYKCFMCDNHFDAVETMLNHISNLHKFDIQTILKSAKISNEYDWIKMVNFLRKNKECINLEDVVNGLWRDDYYLKPQISDDNLLFIDYETILDFNVDEKSEIENLRLKLTESESENVAYKETIAMLRNKVAELLNCNEDNEMEIVNDSSITKSSKLNEEDKAYFSGYSHHSIHDTMINDTVRTESYRKFIEENGSKYFQNKVVLDVGCGTGILSIFAARSGAAHVYGVDCADIIYNAMAIVEQNGLKDKITLIHGKLEEVRLPCDKVDIVISEWMGYFLIYESMLDSVLFACREYLDPQAGLVFPRYFTLNIVGAEMAEFRSKNIDFWDSVYGINMGSMKMDVTKEIIVEVVPSQEIVTDSFLIRDYDVQKMAFDSNLACPQLIEQDFQLTVNRTGKLGAIVGYFDTYFMSPNECDDGDQVMFSTGPHSPSTHWKQTVMVFNNAIDVVAGEVVRGSLVVGRHHQGRRGLMFSLKIDDRVHQNYEFC